MKKLLLAIVTILVLAIPSQSFAAMKFSDVNNRTQNAILEKLSDKKIVSGTGGNQFTPNKSVTRWEMAVFLNRAFDLEPVRSTGTFKDVPKTHTYYNEIQTLYRAGIVNGAYGNYMPNMPVTREQVALVFARLLELEEKQTSKFKDLPLTHSSNGAIGALVDKGIALGFPDGTFGPKTPVTRIQFATFLYRGLYGAEPVFPDRIIQSASIYHATKISQANYINLFGGGLQTLQLKFNTYGYANNQEKWVYMDGLSAGFDGSDHIFFNLDDIVGLKENAARTSTMYYMDDYEEEFPIVVTERVYFDQTVKIGNKTFTNAIKITTRTSDNNNWDFYAIEGFGVVKAMKGNKVFWEMTSFTLR